jgi:hypothetical protein
MTTCSQKLYYFEDVVKLILSYFFILIYKSTMNIPWKYICTSLFSGVSSVGFFVAGIRLKIFHLYRETVSTAGADWLVFLLSAYSVQSE